MSEWEFWDNATIAALSVFLTVCIVFVIGAIIIMMN